MKLKDVIHPYSLPRVGLGADPGVRQSACKWLSHPPSSRLPLLSAGPAVTSVAFTRWIALPVHGSTHPIPAYYSFIDPKRMKGWVGLVGWPVADGLPTIVVTHHASRVWDRGSSPARDRRSTTVLRNQLNETKLLRQSRSQFERCPVIVCVCVCVCVCV